MPSGPEVSALQQSLVPIAILDFQETPNPNALKCVTDRELAVTPKSYFSAAAAESDQLARRLFEVQGVTNLLFVNNWVTVSKAHDASWKAIKAAAREIFRATP